ncbi:MAG: acyltransferase [Mucilaginibacter sp.]
MRRIYNKLQLLATTIGKINYLFAYLWKVKIGKNCLFYGRTYFYRSDDNGVIIIGDNCRFRSKRTSNWIGVNKPCMLSTHGKLGAELIIGNNCGLSGTVIGAFKKIHLGNNVMCGANTTITDSDWHPEDVRSGAPADVIIEDNVWLGVNSIVLKGVTIGENSVIGANSVVTKSIPANAIAAGNPCKVIKLME